MSLLERAKQIRNEQTKSYEKKITMLIEQENYDAAQYLKDKANENIGILDELMFYIERMELVERIEEPLPTFPETDVELHSIRKIEFEKGKEVARAISIARASEKWPELYCQPEKLSQ